MIHKEKDFKPGQRVELTESAKREFGYSIPKTGVIISCGHTPGLLRVVRDGRKNIETWHQSYWKKAQNKA